MPLKNFFEEQLQELRDFLDAPDRTVHAVQHDPDIKQMLQKMLVGLDDESPHVLVVVTSPFHNLDQYFRDLLKELVELNELYREELSQRLVQLPQAVVESKECPPIDCFLRYVSEVADSLPDNFGAFALILDPEVIDDEPGFSQAMERLAKETKSPWAKYLFLDRRRDPILADLPQATNKAANQVFYLSPLQIESKVKADLASGTLSGKEKLQYAAMTGAFAFAHRKYDQAEQIQLEVLKNAEADGEPADVASAHYNLGNTHLANKQFAQAEDNFNRAAAVCLEHGINPLLGMVLVNLGVAVHRLGRIEQSLESFDVARRTFKAMNNVPGEAYVLDCKAAVFALEKRNDEAEATWRSALALYDGITNPDFKEARDGGRRDIVDKLIRFFEHTKQKQKVRELS